MLTDAEIAILRCVARGLTNHEIGRQLGYARHTIDNRMRVIYDKLGCGGEITGSRVPRTKAAVLAWRCGFDPAVIQRALAGDT